MWPTEIIGLELNHIFHMQFKSEVCKLKILLLKKLMKNIKLSLLNCFLLNKWNCCLIKILNTN